MRIRIRKAYKIFGLTLAVGAFSAVTVLARDGGISGGGGGIAPVDTAGPERIEQALREAPLVLSLYFNQLETAELQKPTTLGRLLFEGPVTIQELIKKASIETKGRCRDPHGRRRDGAAPGKRPDSICMDVKALGKKLIVENYWAETVALAGHELSHLLGTNEEEAFALQTKIRADLRSQPPFIAVALRNSYLFSFYEFDRKLNEAIALKPHGPMNVYKAWAGISPETTFLTSHLIKEARSLQAPSVQAYWIGKAIQWKTEYLVGGGFLLGGGSSSSWKKILDQAFEGKSSATLGEIARRLENRAVPASLASLLIELPVDDAAYEREVASILALREEAESLTRQSVAAWTALVDKDYQPAGDNGVRWTTERVQLEARDLQIRVNGQAFGSDISELRVHSDPGSSDSWSLEAEWKEQGKEMRAFFYFKSDGKDWWVKEIRTQDGSAKGNWVYYYGDYFRRPLGQEASGDFTLAGWNEEGTTSVLQLSGLSLRVTPAQR